MPAKNPDESRKMVIYQLLVRLFGNANTNLVLNGTIEQNGVGKFNDISSKALEELKILGITHIWYTGILEHATMSDFSAYAIQPDDWRMVKGRAGSPFAIKDYFDVSPELAVDVPNRLKEFEQLLERTHSKGLKAIIDFIPNHVARSYHSESVEGQRNFFGADDDEFKSFDPQNNFYYLTDQSFSPPADYHPLGMEKIPDYMKSYVEAPAKVTGNNVLSAFPTTGDWFETVKLNFGVNIFNGNAHYFDPIPKTWKYLKEVLSFWTGKGVDGFRCDMAEMVPVEFWRWVIPQIKADYPDVFFIAEIYNQELYENYIYSGGFDYIYDKAGLYDKLAGILKEEMSVDEISNSISATAGFSEHMLYFLENHDEVRVASQQFARNPWAAIPAMALCCTISKGPVMVYFGQETGETAEARAGFGGGNGRTTIYDYWNAPEHQKWVNNGAFDGGLLSNSKKTLRSLYLKILTMGNRYEAIYNGSMLLAGQDIVASDDSPSKAKYLFAFYRYTQDQRILVISNFSKNCFFKLKFNINLEKWKEMGGEKSAILKCTELLTGEIIHAEGAHGEKLLNHCLEMTVAPSGVVIYLLEEQN